MKSLFVENMEQGLCNDYIVLAQVLMSRAQGVRGANTLSARQINCRLRFPFFLAGNPLLF